MNLFYENKPFQTIIIAEAGVNHNGSFELAKKMVDVASEAGVDFIKFQTFTGEKVISRFAPKAEYQINQTGSEESQLEMVKKLELSEEQHEELLKYCQQKNIKFLSTPFDLDSIDLLDRLGLDTLKIPSGEINNLPFLRKIGGLNKKIIMSTGMASLGEVETAIEVLVKAGTQRANISLLHCTTEYPAPIEDVNLKAIPTMREAFQLPVGYSDHTLGIEVSIAAVAMGACIIEKHFTLDKNMEGPDHKASLEPEELKQLVKAIRNTEKALGHGRKEPSPSELKNIPIARKSIVAKRDIVRGERFSDENITVKRPGNGISPMMWDFVIGKIATKDFREDELIEL
ncbi:MAG: N-acetylneuraminate synthase [Bacteroidales bacterium]|nr:N-acetylneuraminate synthase [Bacteroidales bacterium]